MAWDGSECQEVHAWPEAAPPLGKGHVRAAPKHSCVPPGSMHHLPFQVQRDLTQRRYMRREIIPDKDTQGTRCCKFYQLNQILSIVE